MADYGSSEDRSRLLEEFRALQRGFDKLDIKTEKFQAVYFDDCTDMIDMVLGPVFLNLASDGNLNYLFEHHSTIKDANSLLASCLELATRYRGEVLSQQPKDTLEREDQVQLLNQADLIEKLARLACEILHEYEVPN